MAKNALNFILKFPTKENIKIQNLKIKNQLVSYLISNIFLR